MSPDELFLEIYRNFASSVTSIIFVASLVSPVLYFEVPVGTPHFALGIFEPDIVWSDSSLIFDLEKKKYVELLSAAIVTTRLSPL